MFAKSIIDSDAFLDMPSSAQALYFHLAMRADDDGFINNPKKVQRMVGASEDDARLLLMKKFIIAFDSGIVVIKHWRIHNYLRSDRYKPTNYQDEMSLLSVKENGAYSLDQNLVPDVGVVGIPTGIPTVHQRLTQDSIGKDSIDKDRLGKDSKGGSGGKNKFSPPTLEEVKAYCSERGNHVDAQRWFDYYTSNGWKVGKNPMRDWKAAVRTWERDNKQKGAAIKTPYDGLRSDAKGDDADRLAERFGVNG